MAAENNYPVTLTLGLDDKMTRELARSIGRANGSMRKAQSGWQKFSAASVGDKFSMAGKGMVSAGKSMTMGFTLPIAAAGAASVKAAMDFETGMGNIATLVDTSKESMSAMGKGVLDIAKRTPVAIDDLTVSLYDVRSAGVSAADAMRVLETSANLGVAGIGSTKEATGLLTSSLNAFGISAADAGSAANTIFATVRSGKTTISELAQGFGATAPAIAAAGIKLEDYMSNVSALTAVGMPAAQVHSQLKAVISGLTRETTSSRKVFKALGAKDLPDLIKRSGGLNQALTKISGELGGNSAKMLELVGSTEALNAMQALTTTQAPAQVAALELMREESGLLAEANAKQEETTRSKMQMSKNAIEAAAIGIGTRILPVVQRMTDAIASGVESWDKLGESGQNTILLIAGGLAAAGPLITGLGMLSSGLGLIVSISGPIAAGVTAMSAGFVSLTAGFGMASTAASVFMTTIAPLIAIGGTIAYVLSKASQLATVLQSEDDLNAAARANYANRNGAAAASALPAIEGYVGGSLEDPRGYGVGAAAAAGAAPVTVQNHIRVDVPAGGTVTPVSQTGAAPVVDVSRRGPVGG